ncbi:MAG: hypothetical protein K8I00_04720, partial [Candidatus Omnitrophica bacterium]|nr:hypothetical protein [Candidatus Omnitrophota bacterium]
SWDHPIVIVLSVTNGQKGLIDIKMGGSDGGKLGDLQIDIQDQVSSKRVREFLRKTQQAVFWRMESLSLKQRGYDGETWFLEAVRNGRYQVVERWSPYSDVRFLQMGLELLRMAENVVQERTEGQKSLQIWY